MKILIVAATKAEVGPLHKVLESSLQQDPLQTKFFFRGIEIHLLITGAGMTSTAFLLGKTLSLYSYNFVLNLGLCGSFEKKFRIGDVLHVKEDCFSEMGAEDGEKFLSVFDLGLAENNGHPFTNGVLENTGDIKNRVIRALPVVKGISVNTVHGNDESIRKTVKRFHPQIESMEGAAFLFSCLMSDVPCAQIRSVSNYVEKRNKDIWNIPLAIETLHKKTMEILDSFSTYGN